MNKQQQHWKLKYFEKNKYESHVNIFKGLEIESYLKQYFKKYGLSLHNYKINFLTTKIAIYLTINENARTQDEKRKWKQLSMKLFIEQKELDKNRKKEKRKSLCPLCLNEIEEKNVVRIYKNVLTIKRTFKDRTVKIISNDKLQLVHKHCYENDVREKNFKQRMKKIINILPPLDDDKNAQSTFNDKTNILQQSPPRSKKKISKQQTIITTKKLPAFTLIHEPYSKQKFANKKPNYQKIPKNFFKNLLKNLKQFAGNKPSIVIKTKQINEEFFQENIELSFLGIENKFTIPEMKLLYLILLTQKNSANLLSIFISKQLKKTKRHNFFLNLLLQNLTLIMNQKRSRIKGIRILFKGRLNNAPRSRSKIIKLGKIPLIKQNTDNDYSESVSITPNGTIGIKVWINQIKTIFKCFYNQKKLNTKKLKKVS